MKTLYRWIGGWVEIVQGVVTVITFGLYLPSWDFEWAVWWTMRLQKTQQLMKQRDRRR